MLRTRFLVAAAALTLLIAAPIAWYLISPLFITRTVNEDFPAAQAAVQENMIATETAAAFVTTPEAMTAKTDTMSDPTPEAMTATPDATAAPTAVPTAKPDTVAAPTAAPAAAEPKRLRSGEFHPVEHEGTGTATIYELPNGKRVLRLENFEVLNGPDLFVWLSSAPDANSAKTILDSEYVSLGRLKGNQGNQNYELPADLDLSRFNSVTIWCRQFSVNFATAPLS
jgi:hypothetical protein